ncbi:AbfB domain-containing protein [Streptomyces europaeiscabiei]|uniref:AbfB domain-containing protein n=1 Tax=Streptomyces europaeiscabiei TaxID=146819 RepID=UPI002E194327
MSLRSVNYPTRYLRHYSCELRLDVSDGTTAFARDATSPRTADPAESTCTFFRSHDLPTGHITHRNYALRIDLDSTATATDRADATFSIVF